MTPSWISTQESTTPHGPPPKTPDPRVPSPRTTPQTVTQNPSSRTATIPTDHHPGLHPRGPPLRTPPPTDRHPGPHRGPSSRTTPYGPPPRTSYPHGTPPRTPYLHGTPPWNPSPVRTAPKSPPCPRGPSPGSGPTPPCTGPALYVHPRPRPPTSHSVGGFLSQPYPVWGRHRGPSRSCHSGTGLRQDETSRGNRVLVSSRVRLTGT